MVGMEFGQLTVIAKAPDYVSPKGRLRRRWLCSCECGKTTIVKQDHLKGGHSTSCGCKGRIALAKSNADRKKSVYVKRPRLLHFKRAVRKRDRSVCMLCGSKQDIEVHHLYNFTSHNELASSVRNGVCLCKSCHTGFHLHMGGFGVPCTPQDLFEWACSFVNSKNLRRKWKRRSLLQ